MRYTPGELERLSMSFDTPMKNLENEIMTDIVRRIKINGELTRSADWQIYRLHELGVSKRVIRKKIQDLTGLSYREVSTLYKQAIQKGYAEDENIYKYKGKPYIPFDENKQLQQLILATALQTNNTMKNITQSLGFAVKNTDNTKKFLPIAEYYQRTLDNAMLGITTGAFDYTTVLNRTVAELTNSGLRTVDYASGWGNRVEVATRRAVMTGFNQIVAKVNDDNAEKLGTEYFEVSWHGGARPTHQVWQGRVYTKEQLETVCGLGEVTGLCGANCYHSYYPFFPGISERTYTDEQLEEMNKQENIPVEYNGKQYTKYEALQRQRRLETTMRSQRQKIKLLQEGGASEEDVITARARYRVTSAEYTRFSKAMNLPQQRERVTIDGLGNIGAGKYTKSVANSGNRGIIGLRDNGSIYKPVTKESINKIPKLNIFSDDTLNSLHQQASKDLLSEVSKHKPVGTELSRVYDKNMKPIKGCNYIVGRVGSVRIDNPNVPHHAFHNHGSGGTFSPEDLIAMTSRPNQLSLSAIGNNSTVYCMIKTENADGVRYNNFLTKKIGDKSIFYGYSYMDIKKGKLDVSKLNSEQIQMLKNKIVDFGSECAEAGEQFGYKYIYK